MTNAVSLAQQASTGVSQGFKNRIINGAMVIDQRNAGASGSSNTYTVDRWQLASNVSGKLTWQQNQGSVTPPAGFSNYLGFTSSSAYSIGASEYFFANQNIEGYNWYDLNWGTANAKTVTLSFWVRSSLTGTFGGALVNWAGNYSYPFSYTISAANTWEQKSITIAGPTAGTWVGATNGGALQIYISLGTGTTLSGTAGSWSANLYGSATGATSVVGTNGATFYITGVQIEVGSSATSFEYRPYTTELQLCRRYLPTFTNQSGGTFNVGNATCYAASFCFFSVPFDVPARVPPTSLTASFSSIVCYTGGTGYGGNSIFFDTGGSVNNCLVGVGSTSTNFPSTGSLNVRGNGVTILFNGCEL